MKLTEGLTYDDVLLIPQHSFINHRSDVSTESNLTRHIKLQIPFVSANMDTVTESEMAIAMAREGGIGIIHRFMTIAEQVEQVSLVKRHVGFVVESPYTITPDTKLAKVWALSRKTGVNSFIVVDEKNRVVGILGKRDYKFESNREKTVFELMTPLKKLILGKQNTSIKEAKQIFIKHKIEKLSCKLFSKSCSGFLIEVVTAVCPAK